MSQRTPPCWQTKSWEKLGNHAQRIQNGNIHLRDLLQDANRCGNMNAEFDNIYLDYSRQKIDSDVKDALFELANELKLKQRIDEMFAGQIINKTEKRAVLHVALRAPKDASPIIVDGLNVVDQVHEVLDRVFTFANAVRAGEHVGASGKPLTNVVSIGIGGSYLGPEFVFEALKTDAEAASQAHGRTLRFLANVDPVDVSRALAGLNPETTLIVIVSKTFTTAETMLNARTLKRWLENAARTHGWDVEDTLRRHMIALSTNVEACTKFGIASENVFGFWDWVGGRYSVCSAVGVMPLALQYGEKAVRDFLAGAHEMDAHFQTAPANENLPVLLGLIGIWNASFMGLGVRALLPYSQALLRFPAHIQQVDMESNGKRVTMDGTELPIATGEVDFGEPGTNGQHSFYQLIHQGRPMACDFVASVKSQQPIDDTANGEVVSNHDELMSNFFAQPDALACGKTIEELKAEGVPQELWPHKEFPGNRPSSSILFPCFDSRRVGQLLSLYEHRTAVQGFIWGLNSFDQWGVELGKVLANRVRKQMQTSRQNAKAAVEGFNPSTTAMLQRYLQ